MPLNMPTPDSKTALTTSRTQDHHYYGLAPYSPSEILAASLLGFIFLGLLGGANWARYGFPERRVTEILRALCAALLTYLVIVIALFFYRSSSGYFNEQSVLAVSVVITFVLDLLYAVWLNKRQEYDYIAFLRAYEGPQDGNRGGCLPLIGYFVLAGVIGVIFTQSMMVVTTSLTNGIANIITGTAHSVSPYPSSSHTYVAENMSITFPSGWQETTDARWTADCEQVHCVFIAAKPSTIPGQTNAFRVMIITTNSAVSRQDLRDRIDQTSVELGYRATPNLRLHQRDWGGLISEVGVYRDGNDYYLTELLGHGSEIIAFQLFCHERTEICLRVYDEVIQTVTIEPMPDQSNT